MRILTKKEAENIVKVGIMPGEIDSIDLGRAACFLEWYRQCHEEEASLRSVPEKRALIYLQRLVKAVGLAEAIRFRIKSYPQPMSEGEYITMKHTLDEYEETNCA